MSSTERGSKGSFWDKMNHRFFQVCGRLRGRRRGRKWSEERERVGRQEEERREVGRGVKQDVKSYGAASEVSLRNAIRHALATASCHSVYMFGNDLQISHMAET